jgi:ACR3 family arsenite transporter
MEALVAEAPARTGAKRLNVFERWLSLWVALCMVAGIAIGKLFPGFTDALRRLELGEGRQINGPIAVLLWLMIYPMMLRIDLASVLGVRRRPQGILVTVRKLAREALLDGLPRLALLQAPLPSLDRRSPG